MDLCAALVVDLFRDLPDRRQLPSTGQEDLGSQCEEDQPQQVTTSQLRASRQLAVSRSSSSPEFESCCATCVLRGSTAPGLVGRLIDRSRWCPSSARRSSRLARPWNHRS